MLRVDRFGFLLIARRLVVGFTSRFVFRGGSSVAVPLCLCVCTAVYGVCFVVVCSSTLLLLVPREGCASW